ncbi:MAG: hypothetical protein IT379_03870, partial [Deltaproteobacteria bacterium]|nr:hypothetical protein [Deltaproteobacteria bacterium]
MKAIARIGWLGLWLLVAPACGDDDGGTDGGASSDMGGDAGPMCIDPGQSCSFTSCCEGF